MLLMDFLIDMAEEFETMMIEKLMLDTKTQIQEAQTTPSRITAKKKKKHTKKHPTSKLIIFKLEKIED